MRLAWILYHFTNGSKLLQRDLRLACVCEDQDIPIGVPHDETRMSLWTSTPEDSYNVHKANTYLLGKALKSETSCSGFRRRGRNEALQ